MIRPRVAAEAAAAIEGRFSQARDEGARTAAGALPSERGGAQPGDGHESDCKILAPGLAGAFASAFDVPAEARERRERAGPAGERRGKPAGCAAADLGRGGGGLCATAAIAGRPAQKPYGGPGRAQFEPFIVGAAPERAERAIPKGRETARPLNQASTLPRDNFAAGARAGAIPARDVREEAARGFRASRIVAGRACAGSSPLRPRGRSRRECSSRSQPRPGTISMRNQRRPPDRDGDAFRAASFRRRACGSA